MSSALTVIVLGHAFFGDLSPANISPVQHNWTEVLSSIQALSKIEIPNITQLTTDKTTSILDREARRPDYTYIPGIGSHKVHSYGKSWDDAKRICKSEGGDLAVINSEAEAIIVGQLISISQPHIDSEYSDLAHIGFTDREEESRYVTLDGRSLSDAGYDKWQVGEPNDGGDPSSTDDCGAINVGGLLVDANCVRRYAFVCEFPYDVERSKLDVRSSFGTTSSSVDSIGSDD